MKKTDHIVLAAGTNGITCLHCGVVSRYTVPMPVPDLVKRIDAFVKEHKGCEASGSTLRVGAESAPEQERL